MVKKSLSHFLSHLTASEFLFYVFIYGVAVRIFFVLSSDFPLNDGGLFFTMVNELKQSGFHLPLFTSYNHWSIPFVYPPLAFYIAAVITEFLPISLISFFRLFPLLVSALTIPVFYLLAKEFFIPRTALLATFVFTALPRSFEWFIMGGGLTRSLGLLLSLITIYWGIKLFSQPKNKYHLLLSSLFLALTILTHLEWATFAVYSLAVICIKFKNKLRQLLNLAQITLSALLLSSFWWILIINRHGLTPFLSFLRASRAGFNLITSSLSPILLTTLRVTDEPYFTPFAVMGLLGIILCLFTTRYWLLIWLVVPMFIAPRASPNLIVIPLALIVGITLAEMIMPKAKGGLKKSINWPNKVIFFLLVIYSVISLGGLLYQNNVYFNSVSPSQRGAMNWIKINTEGGDKFLLVTQSPDTWGMDNISEWFPALTERVSIVTPQGTEWQGGQKFYRQVIFYSKVKDCYDKGLSCLESVVREENVNFNFVYLEKIEQNTKAFDRTSLVKYNLLQSPKYSVLYENEGAIIFSNKLQ